MSTIMRTWLTAGIATIAVSYIVYRAYRIATKRSPPAIQAVIVNEGDPKRGIGATYRNLRIGKNELPSRLRIRPNLATVWDIFVDSCDRFKDSDHHGIRILETNATEAGPFVWTTYGHTFTRVKNFGSGLVNLSLMGPDVENKMKVLGLFAANCPAWVIAEFACLGFGGTTLPLYTTLNQEEVVYMLNQTGCQTVVCSDETVSRLIDAKKDIPNLKYLIFISKHGQDGVIPSEIAKAAVAANLKCLSFDDIEKSGKAALKDFIPPKPETIFSFCYTSGSTGPPKGVLLSHKAQIANMASLVETFNIAPESALRMGQEYYLSYLPIGHQMERTLQVIMLAYGSKVGFHQGDRKFLMSDVRALRPTVFASVPRVVNRVIDAVLAGATKDGGLKATLFKMGLQAKAQGLKEGQMSHPFWDRLIFRKVAAKLGLDRCRILPVGSAPIAGNVLDALRSIFSCIVTEGYGQTELTCGATVTHGHHFSNSHVGPPIECCEVRLQSVEEMNYLVTDTKHGDLAVRGRGEVCVRGPSLMEGYYRLPEKTRETIDAEGWLHTGDVGCWLENGCLKIIDRAKNIFKLSIGEFVAPEKIENILCRAPLVAQAFVHGTTLNSSLVAVIVPDPEVLLHCIRSNNIKVPGSTDAEIVSNAVKLPEIKSIIMSEIDSKGRAEGLKGFEIPKSITLTAEPFDPSNGILTATMKMQRTNARKVYQADILRMYKELGE